MSSMVEVGGAPEAAQEIAGYDDGWIKNKLEKDDDDIHKLKEEIINLKFKEGMPGLAPPPYTVHHHDGTMERKAPGSTQA